MLEDHRDGDASRSHSQWCDAYALTSFFAVPDLYLTFPHRVHLTSSHLITCYLNLPVLQLVLTPPSPPGPQTCGKPEQPPNSTMIGSSFTVGSTVEYRCDPGHALVGPAQRSCLESGFFNEFPPTCRCESLCLSSWNTPSIHVLLNFLFTFS